MQLSFSPDIDDDGRLHFSFSTSECNVDDEEALRQTLYHVLKAIQDMLNQSWMKKTPLFDASGSMKVFKINPGTVHMDPNPVAEEQHFVYRGSVECETVVLQQTSTHLEVRGPSSSITKKVADAVSDHMKS